VEGKTRNAKQAAGTFATFEKDQQQLEIEDEKMRKKLLEQSSPQY